MRKRLAHDLDHAEQTLLSHGNVAPLFAVTGADGDITPVLGDFSTPEAKDNSFNIVRMLCIAEDAVMVLHRTEAWLVMGDLPEGVSPGQSDRRVEALLVVLMGRVGTEIRSLSSVREILRGADGQPSGLRPLAIPGSKGRAPEMFGPAAQLIPPRRPSADERAIARALLTRMQARRGPN